MAIRWRLEGEIQAAGCLALPRHPWRWRFETRQTGSKGLAHTRSHRIRLLETEEGWAVSCLDLPGCHSQGESRDEALVNIREAIARDAGLMPEQFRQLL